MRTESEATPKKKAPVKVKNLPFPLPKFEATPYTPAPPSLTKIGYTMAKTIAAAKTALSTPPAPKPGARATPTPPRSGTPAAAPATPRPGAAPTLSPVVPTLPRYAPNMSTASGPVYVPPPAISQAQAPYLPMIERAMPQRPEAWPRYGQYQQSLPQGTDFFTDQQVQPNMSTPYGPVYVSPYGELLRAGVTNPQVWTPEEQQQAQPPATPASDNKPGGRARRRYSSGGGYYPSRYYGGGYGGGGYGGGGGGGADYERYGISKPWMEAFKAFWGHDQPPAQWGLYNSIVELFARYAGRMPQLEDWNQLWAAIKEDYTARGLTEVNPYSRLEMYEPLIEKMFGRQPAVQLPTVSYAPGLSF